MISGIKLKYTLMTLSDFDFVQTTIIRLPIAASSRLKVAPTLRPRDPSRDRSNVESATSAEFGVRVTSWVTSSAAPSPSPFQESLDE